LSSSQASARKSKVMSLSDAISEFIFDGASVALEGFTHAIPTAAGHEIIRQGIKDLTLFRQTADIIVDQMLAAGCISTLVSSFVGNSSAGSLGEIRRRIEQSDPVHLNYVEYSHYGMVCRYLAGAQKLPFYPLKSYFGSDLPGVNDEIRKVASPYPNEDGSFDEIYVVPPINPDVTIVHAQRADQWGNIQMWGLTGLQAEAVFAADKAIVTVEEIVPDEIIRSDPNRTIIPSHAVSAVVQVPMGAHPSFTQGYYDRDNNFYRDWSAISGDKQKIADWMDTFIFGTKNHEEYVELLGQETLERLAVGDAFSTPINYGSRI
jgi:glutaconate CoA-transferase, subunit A